MPHKKLEAAVEKVREKRRARKAKKQQRKLRVERNEPKGLREEAMATKRQAKRLGGELRKTAAPATSKVSNVFERANDAADRISGDESGGGMDFPDFGGGRGARTVDRDIPDFGGSAGGGLGDMSGGSDKDDDDLGLGEL